jgi:inorganic pyrophosphatase/exopolyphosphatase
VGAAATLIFEKMKEAKFPVNSNNVYLLFGAIFSNTLNFQSDVVTSRDRAAVEFLKNNYSVTIPSDFIDSMFNYKTEYIANNLEETIIGDFKIFGGGLGVAQLEGFRLAEIVGAKIEEIKSILNKLKEKYELNYIFLTAADIKNGYNILVAIDEDTKLLLFKSMGLNFNKAEIVKNNKLLLRKQMVPLLINNL